MKDYKKVISKADFNKVWSESTTEDILNQFYYEHNDLRELLKENNNKEEVIKKQQEKIDKAIEYINNFKKYFLDRQPFVDTRHIDLEYLLNILQNGDNNEVDK